MYFFLILKAIGKDYENTQVLNGNKFLKWAATFRCIKRAKDQQR